MKDIVVTTRSQIHMMVTPIARDVLTRAMTIAVKDGKTEVSLEHILEAIEEQRGTVERKE